jgi:hypothetical protein
LRQKLKDLERAYQDYFDKRSEYPRFNRKGQDGGFRHPDPRRVKLERVDGRLFLPELGWMRCRDSRAAVGVDMGGSSASPRSRTARFTRRWPASKSMSPGAPAARGS